MGEYLLKARDLTEWVIAHFEEPDTGFFFYTHQQQQDVIVRKKEVYDGAVPSGNAVMAQNLFYLSIVFDRPAWAERSEGLAVALGNAITKHPGSFGVWAMLVQLMTAGMLEIAITGQQANTFLRPVLERFIPNKILQTEETNSDIFPLLAGKGWGKDAETAFYLCKNYACQAPFFTIDALLAKV